MDTFDSALARPDLRLERIRTDGVICFTVAGEVDMTTGEYFRQSLTQALDERGVTRLLLDVAPLRFIDSNGVGVLVRTRRAAGERGVDFGLVNAHGVVRSVLEMLGVYEMLAAEGG